jgi:hypothetical protein
MKLYPLLCGVLLLPLLTARAEFTLIENFEGLAPGALSGQNGWIAGAESTIVSDPAGGSNQVLEYVFGVQSGAYKALGASAIAEGATGTLFARFRFNTTANANFGFSDVAAPAVYNDFEAQINRQNGTAIKGRDGTVFVDLAPLGSPLLADNVDTWYKIWVVANNATDSSRVFIQSDADGDFTIQIEVFSPDGVLNFRFGTTTALITLMLRAQEGTVFWDDFYVSPGTDLTNPIPVSVSDFRITRFEYFPGASIEMVWNALADHSYAIERSENLSAWTTLADTVTANGALASAELFGKDITSASGALYLRVRDLGTAP